MKIIKIVLKSLLFTLIVFGFTNCTKPVSKTINKTPSFVKNLQHTKVIKVFDKNEIKTLINIVYLNNINKNSSNKTQKFIVGIYQLKNEKIKYELSLNGKKPKTIKPIEKNEAKYKNIPFKNNWNSYYLVEFENSKKSLLEFTYKDEDNKIAKIKFEKDIF